MKKMDKNTNEKPRKIWRWTERR